MFQLAMGLINKIKGILSQRFDDDPTESDDPSRTVRRLVKEMAEHVSRTRATLALAVRDEKRLEREVRLAARDIERWHENARVAMESNREALARQALRRKLGAKKFHEELLREHRKLLDNVANLKRYLLDLQTRLKEAQTRERVLLSRRRRLKQAEILQEKFPDRKSEILKSALEDLDDDVARLSYKTLVLEEDSLDRKFRELEDGDARADDELRRLKADIGEENPPDESE